MNPYRILTQGPPAPVLPPPSPAPMPPGVSGPMPPQDPAPVAPVETQGAQTSIQYSQPRAHLELPHQTDAELLTAPTKVMDEHGSFLGGPFRPGGIHDVLGASSSQQTSAFSREQDAIRRFRLSVKAAKTVPEVSAVPPDALNTLFSMDNDTAPQVSVSGSASSSRDTFTRPAEQQEKTSPQKVAALQVEASEGSGAGTNAMGAPAPTPTAAATAATARARATAEAREVQQAEAPSQAAGSGSPTSVPKPGRETNPRSMPKPKVKPKPEPESRARLPVPVRVTRTEQRTPQTTANPEDKFEVQPDTRRARDKQHQPTVPKRPLKLRFSSNLPSLLKLKKQRNIAGTRKPAVVTGKRKFTRSRFIDDEAEVDEDEDADAEVPSGDEGEDASALEADDFVVDDGEIVYDSSQEDAKTPSETTTAAEEDRGLYRSLDNALDSLEDDDTRDRTPAKKPRVSRDIPGHDRTDIGPTRRIAPRPRKPGRLPPVIDLEKPRHVPVEKLVDMIKSPERLWPSYQPLCDAVRHGLDSILKTKYGADSFELSASELADTIKVLLVLAESALLPHALALKHAQMENEGSMSDGNQISEQVLAVEKFNEQFKQENMRPAQELFGQEQIERLSQNFKAKPGTIYPCARLFTKFETLRSFAYDEVEIDDDDDDDGGTGAQTYRCSFTGRALLPGDRVYLLQVYSYCSEEVQARGEDRMCFYIARHHIYPLLYMGQVCVYIMYRWQRSKFTKRILDWSENAMRFGPSASPAERLAAFLRAKNVNNVAAIIQEYFAFKWLFKTYINRGPQASSGGNNSSARDTGPTKESKIPQATASSDHSMDTTVSVPDERVPSSKEASATRGAGRRVAQQNAAMIVNRF